MKVVVMGGSHVPVVARVAVAIVLAWPADGRAQDNPPPNPAEIHEHVGVTAPLLTPTRESSGTSWLPALTPMYGVHSPWGGWDIRLNGIASVQAVYEPNNRHRTGGPGSRQVASPNWAMFMARRSLAGGRFGVRTMFSAEPWTVPGCGSLSFLAVGDRCAGETTHDRQQPHDVVMELAVDYDRPLAGDWRWQIYAGVAGEPALGPPGYLHRPSAVANPIGPMTHHWLDAGHATFGVVTGAVHNRRWKAEVSAFNGRGSDDSRVNLDLGTFDSFSARVSVLATERLAMQVSAGRVREPGSHHSVTAEVPVTRVNASAAYHVPIGTAGIWATTVGYASNQARELAIDGTVNTTTAAGLIESSATFATRHTVFGRGEVAGMPAHHLHAFEYETSILTVGKVQLGYVRHLRVTRGMVPGIGGSAALSLLPPQLARHYSGRIAPTFAMFFSLQAARHQM